jgi:hypothetical protein
MYWSFETYLITNGVKEITGTLQFEDFQWVTFYQPNSTGSPAWDHGLVIATYDGWGDLIDGLPLDVTSMCYDPVAACVESAVVNRSVSPAFAPWTNTTYEWEEADPNLYSTPTRDLIHDLSGLVGVNIISPFYGTGLYDNGTFDGTGETLAVRCDSVNGPTSLTIFIGCVDHNTIPTLTYDARAYPKVGPVADHIYNAQQSLPVKYGNRYLGPHLTRDTNDKDRNLNSAMACAGVTTAAGESCDEYPMASTYQGAYFIGAANASAIAVPAEANNSQGGITNNFYRDNRILDRDAFWVRAIRSDGSTSW